MEKVVLTGKVTRVAKLNKPSMMEFSAEISEIQIGSSTLTIGDKLDFEVNTFVTQKASIRNAINNLALGDKVTVEMKKNDQGAWEIADMSHVPQRGRPVGSFLDDIEKELAHRNAK